MLRALEDGADVIEVMRNHSGEVVVDRHGHGMEAVGTMSDLEAEELIGTVAALNHRVANDKNPILEAELPISRARFTGVLPPVTLAPVDLDPQTCARGLYAGRLRVGGRDDGPPGRNSGQRRA